MNEKKNLTLEETFSLAVQNQQKNNLQVAENLYKEINLIKENILIIGGSSGIGNDLMKLFLNNNKIKIISTYYKNKINEDRKNLIVKKLNIETDLVAIYKIIKKFEPIIIYYFPTPKIFFLFFLILNIFCIVLLNSYR